MLADGDTIFEGVFDDSTGSVAADYTPTSSLVGSSFGLTIDASGYYYIDRAITGSSAVVQIVGQNPDYGFGQVNGRVRFVVLAAARYINNVL
jgi:hypothetical protein